MVSSGSHRGEILCAVDFGLLCVYIYIYIYNEDHQKFFILNMQTVRVADWGLLSFGLLDDVVFVQVGGGRNEKK